MRALRILTAVTLLSLASGTARADGLLYQLPKDGAWVVFDWQGNLEFGGKKFNSKGSLTMSSVGRTMEGDDECRWIEFKREAPYTPIYKVLIPEKYLRKGENPFDHMVRAWFKAGDRDVRELDESTAGPYLSVWLGGPLDDAEKLDKKVVDSKLSKLECEGLTGYTEYKSADGRMEIQSTHHIWLHKKALFGVVSARIKSETTLNGQPYLNWTATLKLSDFGEGAESELPNHN